MYNKAILRITFVAATTLLAFAQNSGLLTVKQLMTADEFRSCGLEKLSAKELTELDAWLQRHTLTVIQVMGSSAKVTGKDTFAEFEGCSIIADDGEYLGMITKNRFDAKSIVNEFGKHGSEFGSVSILNKFGKYGSEFSQLSPFNEYASKPPKIIGKDGKFLAYLTKNSVKTPRVDPHALVGWIKSQ